ncbi:MAG: hypothetical protein JF586_04830, partial [Burkholderiales bacterium]|nr:hypothetical protein [Burkholderiales bacterium]
MLEAAEPLGRAAAFVALTAILAAIVPAPVAPVPVAALPGAAVAARLRCGRRLLAGIAAVAGVATRVAA